MGREVSNSDVKTNQRGIMSTFMARGEGQTTQLALVSTQTLASDSSGYEALKSEGHPEIEDLLRAAANPMVPSEDGMMALHLASVSAGVGVVSSGICKVAGMKYESSQDPGFRLSAPLAASFRVWEDFRLIEGPVSDN